MAQAPLSFQRPIETPIGNRKKLANWKEPENPVRYAFAKLLRERDKTRRVYPVNPYTEVYTLRDNVYGLYCESLDGMGDSWIFVIDGPERALVIDTAWGLGDLKGLLHELLGEKPYYVANTHPHKDHTFGNYQFDTVYCHEYDVPALRAQMNPHVWDELFDANGEPIWYDFRREELIAYHDYNLIGVPDGYIFDLGSGYEVELMHMGGHSSGHCGFLDKTNRIFFPGDDCCVGAIGIGGRPDGEPFREYATVEAFRDCLKKITARADEFDSLFPSHGPVETGPVMLFSALEAAEAILADPRAWDDRAVTPRGVQYGKMIFESGYLRYTTRSVYKDRTVELD